MLEKREDDEELLRLKSIGVYRLLPWGINHPRDLTRGVYANLRHELHYRPELNGRIFQYRTKHDVEVPLFDAAQVKLGVMATLDTVLRPKTLASAQAFTKKHSAFKCLIAYAGKDAVLRSDKILLIPYWWLI